MQGGAARPSPLKAFEVAAIAERRRAQRGYRCHSLPAQ